MRRIIRNGFKNQNVENISFSCYKARLAQKGAVSFRASRLVKNGTRIEAEKACGLASHPLGYLLLFGEKQ
ncbi:hypothetical protein XV74_04720 [Vibrio cholerae]|nr:hypothetical protein XV74_04720 [Vibrio cholerae]KQA45097.1 hypothetical protein XV75_10900 [Vibrio cholerae]KQA57257.1 hypothetical protein XV79_08605 [Vibrio cholerae]KQA72233.1 hypothetical protein XV84_16525 [Vibrio cholerae]KQA80467.1 hypothetical protein XV85_01190 [Vibrio cholerae]